MGVGSLGGIWSRVRTSVAVVSATTAAVTIGSGAVTTPQALAYDAYPCGPAVSQPWSTKGKVQLCPLTAPESNGGIPVYGQPAARSKGAELPAPQGWLHGTADQYFVCQQRFRSALHYHARGWRNNWWAYTASDSGITWGWVPEVYFTGGRNDEPDRKLRVCNSPKPPAAAPKPQSERARCGSARRYQRLRINDDQRLPIKAHAIDHLYREITTTTPPERHTHHKRRHRAGSVALHLATCKRRGRPWRLLRAGNQSIRVDHPTKLHELGAGGTWYGFAVRRVKPRYRSLRGERDQVGRVHVEGILCQRDPDPWLLKALLGFPIPGASYAVSVGQWILGAIWPDSNEIECGKLDSTKPRLYVNKKTGRLSMDPFVVAGYVNRWPESQDGFYLVERAIVRGRQARR